MQRGNDSLHATGFPCIWNAMNYCEDSLHATGFPCIRYAMDYCEDSLHATGFLGMQQFRVLAYIYILHSWPKLRDSSVAIAAIERIRSVTMLKLSCFDTIISHFKAHHRLNLLLDPKMTKNDKEIRAITLQLQKRQKRQPVMAYKFFFFKNLIWT